MTRHNTRTRIPLDVVYTAPELKAPPAYTPIGARRFTVETKSLTDMRIAYRWACKCCPVRGAWLVDRADVERNGATHVAHGCEAQEAVAS